MQKFNFQFVKYRFVSFSLAFFMIAFTLFKVFSSGLNYGIDFKGGYVMEVRLAEKKSLSTLREQLSKLKIGEVSIQQIGSDQKDLLIKMEKNDQSNDVGDQLDKVKKILGTKTEYRKIETVGPKVGDDLIRSAVKSIIIALGCMLVYITIRFQWQYAVSGIVTLVHDCILILSLFTIFGFEFSESAIIGILITAGYSINDTIVIFDRIRENVARRKKLGLSEILDLSINETLSRTTLTVFTTLLSLGAMYFFGGKVIAEFSMPIILGVMAGTFSSIFISAPLLLHLGFSTKSEEEIKQEPFAY